MKIKILKLSVIALLFLFMGASCEKDEWETIELKGNACGEVIGVLETLTDVTGIIGIKPEISTTIHFIIVSDKKSSVEILLIPCNLPEQYHKNGLEITFTGEVLDIKDWEDGESDLLGAPVNLLTAQIKK